MKPSDGSSDMGTVRHLSNFLWSENNEVCKYTVMDIYVCLSPLHSVSVKLTLKTLKLEIEHPTSKYRIGTYQVTKFRARKKATEGGG